MSHAADWRSARYVKIGCQINSWMHNTRTLEDIHIHTIPPPYPLPPTHTNTHTYIYIYIYIYTLTHTHARTHARTHTLNSILFIFFFPVYSFCVTFHYIPWVHAYRSLISLSTRSCPYSRPGASNLESLKPYDWTYTSSYRGTLASPHHVCSTWRYTLKERFIM